ncbi:hypothetical protein JCM11251_003183 [Rhodosporidiobolus azoricus]
MTTELSISGPLPSTLYAAALARLSTFTSSGESFGLSESVYGRAGATEGPADTLGSAAAQVVRVKALRLRRPGGDADSVVEWSIQVNQRPEAPRTAPRAMQHGVIEFAVEEGSDPRSLVDALGFSTHLFSTHKRGVRFQRGAVLVEIFQLYESPESSAPLDPSSYVVTASTRFSSTPTRSSGGSGSTQQQQNGPTASSQEVRENALASIEQVTMLLKGLCDLSRVD